MIFKHYPIEKLEIFFLNDFEEENPLKVFLLIIFTLGIYALSWIYKLNTKLELIDDEAPDSKRAFSVLFILPFGWTLIYFVLLKLIFQGTNIYLSIFNYVVWSALIFLSLKYVYDFCISFGKLTRTLGIVWYFLIYSGYLGIIVLFFQIYYMWPLIVIPVLTIPSMQIFLNISARYILEEAERGHFKSKENKGSY